jgi:hypothetical protein
MRNMLSTPHPARPHRNGLHFLLDWATPRMDSLARHLYGGRS